MKGWAHQVAGYHQSWDSNPGVLISAPGLSVASCCCSYYCELETVDWPVFPNVSSSPYEPYEQRLILLLNRGLEISVFLFLKIISRNDK